MQIDLPDLEKTLVTLAVELLRAPHDYPDLVVSKADAQGEVSRNAVRVTQHYLSALLAYGFPYSYEAVRQAADWFAAPFPTEDNHRIDTVEMIRLEALLSVRPVHESVPARLQQLIAQRNDDGQFDLQSDNLSFDTLWALKVLNMARRADQLEAIMPLAHLRTLVDDLLRNTLADKDLALALNLRYELFGNLTERQQKRYLQKLLDNWKNGLWDVPNDMLWIPDSLRRQQLALGEMRAHRDPFRKMLVSTFYVVENLAPLVDLYPEAAPALRTSVELWWNVFYQNPAQMLHELFPKPYDYVIMLARTLIMLRAAINAPLIECSATHIYQELVTQRDPGAETAQRRNLRRALEKLIAVDFDGEPDSLRLGLSGSNVVRVRPHVESLYDNTRLNIADTLIVKYGPKDSIDAERSSFMKLPDALRSCYVRIPQDTFTDVEEAVSYVVMPDLHDYTTLFENVRTIPQIQKALTRELPQFLIYTHQAGGWNTIPAPTGIIQDMYLLPMQMHVSGIFKYLRESGVLMDDAEKAAVTALFVRINDLCADLVRRQYELEKFPRAYMHGDLHSRNIMIRLNARRNPQERELDFKLIDLEKFSAEGDAAMDLGELLVDLELLLRDLHKQNDRQHPLALLARALTDAYGDFARQRRDDLFNLRVPLAQARFSIRVAKGKTRLVDLDLKRSKHSAALATAREILRHCTAAADYLESVVTAVGSDTNHTPPFLQPEEQ
ncbi:MAG TPA: hypothetical protein VHD90_11460 [Phototrophicaceae bacterium]|nr:hypothetical protein [Phototrophicaceae bacterium]